MKYNKELKPIEKIELNEKNIKIRFILFIISLFVIVGSAIIIIISFNKVEDGWSEIISTSSINCDEDFEFYYNLGKSGESPAIENKAISNIYTQNLEKAYILFDSYRDYPNYNNIFYINHNLNTEIEIDPILYDALEMIYKENKNILYFGPIYNYYDRIIFASDDDEAKVFDPKYNKDGQVIINEIIQYIDNSIELEFFSNNIIKLNVSVDYQNYLKELGINNYIDFGWLKNAFIIDYLADVLRQNNYTNGYLATFDGYSINLSVNSNFKLNILENYDNYPSIVSQLTFNQPLCSVLYRSYMYYRNDLNRYYKYEDGKYVHYYIDKDGLSKSSLDTLTCYSYNLNCREIALKSYSIFINDTFYIEHIKNLNDQINFVWTEGKTIYYTDSSIDRIKYYNSFEGEYYDSKK